MTIYHTSTHNNVLSPALIEEAYFQSNNDISRIVNSSTVTGPIIEKQNASNITSTLNISKDNVALSILGVDKKFYQI